nr:immunoglobulin heavy chain junction region [Macaca mulatta]MOW98329.1 immunoglobulin heavy chain junction region [Macaca mulatta]MOW99108.1 immunoglobulin heavy chain junction region [Macaca mulatta]MOX00373.1 immunoglobulin heavy chain junction region [Macaca mulatta]MOX01657.1 immunoglobulin heavy chain junction region [Macaca mulatta]
CARGAYSGNYYFLPFDKW